VNNILIDYGNILMFGLPSMQLNKLQKILNTAARMTTLTKKYEHITPVLKDLHWLNVEERIAGLDLYIFSQSPGGYQVPKFGRQIEILIKR
jgi:hypothetical protein